MNTSTANVVLHKLSTSTTFSFASAPADETFRCIGNQLSDAIANTASNVKFESLILVRIGLAL